MIALFRAITPENLIKAEQIIALLKSPANNESGLKRPYKSEEYKPALDFLLSLKVVEISGHPMYPRHVLSFEAKKGLDQSISPRDYLLQLKTREEAIVSDARETIILAKEANVIAKDANEIATTSRNLARWALFFAFVSTIAAIGAWVFPRATNTNSSKEPNNPAVQKTVEADVDTVEIPIQAIPVTQ